MTRIEKWQSYRDEIAKHSRLNDDINQDNAKIFLFKSEIDRINPGILALSENEVSLESGVSNVKIEQKQIASEISEMFQTINVAKNLINDENVETMFHQMKNDSIVENKELKKEFLDSSEQYKYFEENAREFLVEKDDEKTSKELEAKFNTFKAKHDSEQIDSVSIFSNNNKKQASHYVFVISIAVSALLFLIVVALFIARLVLK